eukprot:7948018-Heterocapsa_arctica.AAC.1
MRRMVHPARNRRPWRTIRSGHAPLEGPVSSAYLLPAIAARCGGQAQASLCKPGPPTTYIRFPTLEEPNSKAPRLGHSSFRRLGPRDCRPRSSP